MMSAAMPILPSLSPRFQALAWKRAWRLPRGSLESLMLAPRLQFHHPLPLSLRCFSASCDERRRKCAKCEKPLRSFLLAPPLVGASRLKLKEFWEFSQLREAWIGETDPEDLEFGNDTSYSHEPSLGFVVLGQVINKIYIFCFTFSQVFVGTWMLIFLFLQLN